MSPDPRSTVSSWNTTYTDSGYAPSHGSAPRRRKSSPFPPLPTLQAILRLPRILHCLLSFIPYADFNALTSSCPELRDLMREPVLKDTVLSYFLPGFRSLLRSKTPELFVDVRVTVGDLNIFHLSNKVGLHVYPIHALQLSARLNNPHQLKLLRKLQSLTVVHSKFVLLLQSLAHSSLQPPELQLEDNSPPRSILHTSPPGIKQLYFPEPLCYSASPAIHRTPSYHRHKRSQSVEIVIGESKAPGRKKSLLRRSKQPLPPPSPDFLIRQSYFSPWRRILQSPSLIGTPEPAPPQRRRVLNTSNSSDSSLSTSPRLSMVQEGRRSSSIPRLRPPLLSPHDIHFATSRSHAPILRVFVPCSEFNDLSIVACEDQLTDAGLWNHLSMGDIVCNLGYMPPLPPPEHDLPRDSPGAASASLRGQPTSFRNSTTDDAVWLVFDGFGLVQYSPFLEPPPLKDPMTLVTPYYYSHILPTSAHPFFTLDLYSKLSRFRENTFPPLVPPKFELIAMLTKVRSSNSPGGYAMVKRYKWVATIKGIKAALSGNLGVGSGWLTDEWTLEADGTVEGRMMLDTLLSSPGAHVAADWARGDWVWEIDRQRSNLGKTWFRSLGGSEDYALPLDPAALCPTSPMLPAQCYKESPGSAPVQRHQFSFMAR